MLTSLECNVENYPDDARIEIPDLRGCKELSAALDALRPHSASNSHQIHRFEQLLTQPNTATIMVFADPKSADRAVLLFPNHVCIACKWDCGDLVASDLRVFAGRTVSVWSEDRTPDILRANWFHDVLEEFGARVEFADLSARMLVQPSDSYEEGYLVYGRELVWALAGRGGPLH